MPRTAADGRVGGEKGRGVLTVNVARNNSDSRFTALLVEGEGGLGMESTLRARGCSVHRATTRHAAREAIEGVDLVLICAVGFTDEEVLDIVGRAALGSSVLVATDKTELAIAATRLGAATVMASLELVSAQIGQILSLVDLKRRTRASASQSSGVATNGANGGNGGSVQRRSTPLPKEATPEAMSALIESAEGLVPMHRFQRVYVDYALRRFGGNKVHTAAALGIDRRTIQRWARARAEENGQPEAHEAVS